MNRLPRTFVHGTARLVVVLAAFVLASCGGSSGPPDQDAAAERVEMTGTVVGGDTSDSSAFYADPSARGATGLVRTGSSVAGSLDYRVSLTQLTAPYALRASFANETELQVLVTLATRPGIANMTPLTHLMVAQLFGQDPELVFNTFDAGSAAAVTDAGLSEAQAKVIAFLQGELGVTVEPGTGDFVTTPFRLEEGDPMFDTISNFLAKMAEDGSTLPQLTAQVAAAARLCILERITVTIAGAASDFCPQSKSATPEDADTTVIAYVFDAPAGGTLTVRARDSSVLTGQYVALDGTVYSCSGAACSGVALGTPAGNLTRPLVFSGANWSSAGSGTAAFNGTLVGAVPGVVLPPLPCPVNGFYLVLPDRQVKANCGEQTAVSAIGLEGTFNAQRGATRRWLFSFVGIGGEGLPPSDGTTLHVELEGDELIAITATRNGPGPNGFDIDYKCRGADCTGVTVGPATINTDFGFDIEQRVITLASTPLALVQADGTLSTTVTATATASLSTVGFDFVVAGFTGLPRTDCLAVPQSVLVKTTDDPLDYLFCSEFGIRPPSTTVLPDGGLAFSVVAPNESSTELLVETNAAGEVTRVFINLGQHFQRFECTTDCSGVTVSAPNGAGQRTISFAGTVMRELEPDGFATGDRTAVANGSYLAPAP